MYQNKASERTLRNLVKSDKRVYVYSADSQTIDRFIVDAEREGFTFSDGVKPSERTPDYIMALHEDGTICYVGFVGHMAFGCAPLDMLCVDYRKYADGDEDYIIRRAPRRVQIVVKRNRI